MAERVVLADIVFEEEGAVSSLKRTDLALVGTSSSVDTLAKHTRDTSSVFVNRMFSMRQAAVAFLGAFTVGGVIIGLKNLISEAARQEVGFKNLAASAKVFHQVMLDIIKDLPGFSKGIGTLGDLLLSFGAEFRTIFSKEGFEALTKDLKAALLGEDSDSFVKLFQRTFEKLKTERDSLLRGAGNLDVHFPLLASDQGLTTAATIEATKNWLSIQREANGLVDETITAFQSIGFELDILISKYQQYINVLGAASEFAVAAAASGLASQSTAARAAMAIVAVQAYMHGLEELAFAAASAAAYDYRGAILHKIAAGLFFATAAFQGAAAIRGPAGSGGGGGGGGGTGFRGVSIAPAQRLSPNVSITIEGSVIGAGGKEQLAHDLAELIKKALSDGAASGTLSTGYANA